MQVLIDFYKVAIESVLTFHISLWQGLYMGHDRNASQKLIKTALKIIEAYQALSNWGRGGAFREQLLF